MTDSTPCRDWLTSGGEDLWHPESWGRAVHSAEALAKRICRTCPVQLPCLTTELAYEAANPAPLRHGVYGGLTADERRQLARKANA